MRMYWTLSDRDPIDRQYTDTLKLGSSWRGRQSFHPKGSKFRPNTDYYKKWDVTMDNVNEYLPDSIIREIQIAINFYFYLIHLVTSQRQY